MTECYFNLHKRCLSLRRRHRVFAHVASAVLTDVVFRVQASGRRRAQRVHQKNVHAFVRGHLLETSHLWITRKAPRVFYGPYGPAPFFVYEDGTPIHKAKKVLITGTRIYVLEP